MLLRDKIYQVLRHGILSCEFPPGQALQEQTLAERYGVSRTPVRDSLLRLAQENLVIVQPRQGYVVKPLSISDVEDMLSLRSVIEPASAAAAAQADDTSLQMLDGFRSLVNQVLNETGYVDYNESFHQSIADLSGNKRIAAVASDLIQQFQRVVRILAISFNHEAVRRDHSEHEAIIDAIQAHDADRAFRLAREHTEGTRERVRTLALAATSRAVSELRGRSWRIRASLPDE
jgi:GntR family transcriptional regulator, rspAB operon transcriptional repressor